jgi:hypothetical protein
VLFLPVSRETGMFYFIFNMLARLTELISMLSLWRFIVFWWKCGLIVATWKIEDGMSQK